MRKPEGWDRSAILADKNVATWFESNKLRSKLSAENDLRKLALLTYRIGTTPDGVATLARKSPDELARRLVRYATEQKRNGRLDTYLLKTFSGLKAWLRFRRVTFDLYPKLRGIQGLSIRNETVPTQDQLGRILGALTVRGRAVALLMAHSGLRPGAIAQGGTSGLRLSDVQDLSLDGAEPEFSKRPFLLRVPAALSKTAREYVTFGSDEEARAILTYLASRRAAGERLEPTSPLIGVAPHQSGNWTRGSGRNDGFVTTETLTYELRTGMRKVQPSGTRWRPYVLRSYCSTRMVSAENAGKVTRDVREAILGHDLGVSGRYNLSKKLHPEQIEEMRAAYKRCEPFLSTVPTSGDSDRVRTTLTMLLRYSGYSEGELSKLDIESKTTDELLALAEARRAERERAAAHPGQKAVPIAEVGPMLAAGWEYVAPLGSDRAVLRGPH
jgi:hypothetical protein